MATGVYQQFQSIQGPADSSLPHTTTEGLQPVSRIGEVVLNAFPDSHEFVQLPDALTAAQMTGATATAQNGAIVEYRPHFHEWATIYPGMICLTRKARNVTFRNYTAAETAVPVIGCAACLTPEDSKNFYFAGVCRSKTIRPIDDGVGPQIDEYFTVAVGGLITMLNNSSDAIFPGDVLEWTMYSENVAATGVNEAKRPKSGPRRVGIAVASPTSERVIGTCKTFAKSGEYFDLLIRA